MQYILIIAAIALLGVGGYKLVSPNTDQISNTQPITQQTQTDPTTGDPLTDDQRAELNQAEQTLIAFYDGVDENAQTVATESGLQYAVLTQGTSNSQPSVTDTVVVHYHGLLLSGEVFDSSVLRGEPVEFPLQGLIPGWQEGIPLMTVGSKYRFLVPAELAYGPEGAGHPLSGQPLVFDVELIAIK